MRRQLCILTAGLGLISLVAVGAPPAAQAATTFAALGGVTCASASNCWAVGGSGSPTDLTLAERWNGSKWSVVSTPNPAGAAFASLGRVACPSAASCLAVGASMNSHSDTLPLAERWNGTVWSLTNPATPAGGTDTLLSDIACPSAASCMAVGSSAKSASHAAPLAEHWNGTSWTMTKTVVPAGSSTSGLMSIACTGASTCIAVGSASYGTTSGKTLVESWNGSAWTDVSSPNPAGATFSSFYSIACLTATNCFAGGTANTGTSFLIEHWNGSNWSVGTMPRLGTTWPIVEGIACPVASSCVAVSRFGTGKWNGSTWTAVPFAAVAGANHTELAGGVTCTAATSCTAVGDYTTTGPVYHTLVEVWNGTSWHVVTSPN